jgi:putative ABC transport system substrate-binding protein
MRRRDFTTLLFGAAIAGPFAARAEPQEQMRLMGVLMGYPESDLEAQTQIAAFKDELKKLGWTEDHNARIETRWVTPTDAAAMQRTAKELVALQPNVILSSTTPTTATLLQQTRTIPIVFGTVGDPVGSGFIASLARPGGNVTGFTTVEGSLGGKYLEILKELAPKLTRVSAMFNPAAAPYVEYFMRHFQTAAQSLGRDGEHSSRARCIRNRTRH